MKNIIKHLICLILVLFNTDGTNVFAQEKEPINTSKKHKLVINHGISIATGNFKKTGNWLDHGGTAENGIYTAIALEFQFLEYFLATFSLGTNTNEFNKNNFQNLMATRLVTTPTDVINDPESYVSTFAMVGIKGIIPIGNQFKFYLNPKIGRGTIKSPFIDLRSNAFFNTFDQFIAEEEERTSLFGLSIGIDAYIISSISVNLDASYLKGNYDLNRIIKQDFTFDDTENIQNIKYSTMNISLGLAFHF
jgi:hypothetical protein